MGEKDEKSQEEDTEGQGKKFSTEGTEDDTEGHRRLQVSTEGTEDEDTEGQSRRRVSDEGGQEDDSEGHVRNP